MKTTKLSPLQAENMNPWELAQLLSTSECEIQFTGDMDPFSHGGTFYENSNWNEYGYASCVRFEDIDGKTLVSMATINKPDDDEMKSAYKCCDTPSEFRDSTVGQIEACLGYFGAETEEDFSGRYEQWFGEDDESDAWKLASPWIQGLC